ncbi:hypothetical protein AK812_SmicGene26360 [Symbiodinium microadriaticum]|uniref:Uncharacterized protein n=1 Tax=Symbiodinium microadriaticum TaxID=2951 RepID=A0A1Q9D9N7_SYMMI|nr:hypothetical protein AK812_SmicGene26360 [Symbiodinium microadriaticum]
MRGSQSSELRCPSLSLSRQLIVANPGAEHKVVLRVQKDLRQGLRDMYEHAKDRPLLLFVDPKRYYSTNESFAAAPVGHPNMFAAERDVLFEENLFRPDKDLVVVFDGRCTKTAGYIKDLMKKAVKSKLIGQRGAPLLRLLHHNGELALRKKRAVCTPCSVDPLVRGFSNLSLRSAASLELNKVNREVKEQIFSHISFASTGADSGQTLQPQQPAAAGSDEEEEEPRQDYVTLVQWEHPEELFAEFIHLYSSAGMDDVIGDVAAGSGIACLADIISCRRDSGFVTRSDDTFTSESGCRAVATNRSVQRALIGHAAFPRTPETIEAADNVIFEKSQNCVQFYPSIGAAICWKIRDSISDGEMNHKYSSRAKTAYEVVAVFKQRQFRIISCTVHSTQRAWEAGFISNVGEDGFSVPEFRLADPDFMGSHILLKTWMTTMAVVFDCTFAAGPDMKMEPRSWNFFQVGDCGRAPGQLQAQAAAYIMKNLCKKPSGKRRNDATSGQHEIMFSTPEITCLWGFWVTQGNLTSIDVKWFNSKATPPQSMVHHDETVSPMSDYYSVPCSTKWSQQLTVKGHVIFTPGDEDAVTLSDYMHQVAKRSKLMQLSDLSRHIDYQECRMTVI